MPLNKIQPTISVDMELNLIGHYTLTIIIFSNFSVMQRIPHFLKHSNPNCTRVDEGRKVDTFVIVHNLELHNAVRVAERSMESTNRVQTPTGAVDIHFTLIILRNAWIYFVIPVMVKNSSVVGAL